MTRVHDITPFLEAIKESGTPEPPSSSNVRQAVQTGAPQASEEAMRQILKTLGFLQKPVEVTTLKKETGLPFVEFAYAIQDLEKLNAVVVNRSTSENVVAMGPAWQDIWPLLMKS